MVRYLILVMFVSGVCGLEAQGAELVGVTVTPHVIAEAMRYRRPREPDLAARVQLFVKGPGLPITFDGKSPADLVRGNEWAWHDLAAAVEVPEGALSVWTFNGKSTRWGLGREFELVADGLTKTTIPIAAPQRWIYVATKLPRVRPEIAARRNAALTWEEAYSVDLRALESLKK